MRARLVLWSLVCAAGCGLEPLDGAPNGEEAFSSARATLVEFEFAGEVQAPTVANASGRIRAQLMYTVGQLNGESSVARLGALSLSDIRKVHHRGAPPDQAYTIRYRARMQVAWGRGTPPKTYPLVLPSRVDDAFAEQLVTRYGSQPACRDPGREAINKENYWFHYRPQKCSPSMYDVVRTMATVSPPSALNTNGSMPEYDRVWEDGSLDVVAVFGKSEPKLELATDLGRASYQTFLTEATRELSVRQVRSERNGEILGDTTLVRELPDGRSLSITALLVPEVRSAGAIFDARYAELVTGADLVLYNGHAGLGSNVRSLVQKGNFFPDKYQIFALNGCDTFAYVDNTLARTRAALNPADRTGTKHMDMIVNVMPGYFNANSPTSITLIRMLLGTEAPKTYQQAFQAVDVRQVIAVTGDEDNAFRAGTPIPSRATFVARGAVAEGEAANHVTAELEPGRYAVVLTSDAAAPGGDADLRVRLGKAPLATDRCDSYVGNSNERCVIDVRTKQKAFISVTGDRPGMASGYVLRVFPLKER